MSQVQKRRRLSFSAAEKLLICQVYNAHIGQKAAVAVRKVCERIGYSISRPTILGIVKDEQRLHVSAHITASKRLRPCKFPVLDSALIKWISQANANNAIITDDIILQKARALKNAIRNEGQLSLSKGWLYNLRSAISSKALIFMEKQRKLIMGCAWCPSRSARYSCAL